MGGGFRCALNAPPSRTTQGSAPAAPHRPRDNWLKRMSGSLFLRPGGKALSEDEEKRLLRAAADDKSPNRNPMIYAFIQVALTTGMRAGEIAKLRWSQIDFSANALTVGRA